MDKLKVTPLMLTSRLLVGGAAFLFILLIGATAFTSGVGLDVRERLTADAAPEGSRLAASREIGRLLGRGGFSGELLTYAAEAEAGSLQAMVRLLDLAEAQLERFSASDLPVFAEPFAEITRGRIAEGRLTLVSLNTATRNPVEMAIDYSDGAGAFAAAIVDYQQAEQSFQTQGALGVMDAQRLITIAALAISLLVLGAAAALLQYNVRRPLRDLALNLEDLLIEENDRRLPEATRSDEVGMVARVAEDLRRSQLQAGRLLTMNADGALRLRLEGENAQSVDTALGELTTAADEVRSTALALSATGEGLACDSQDMLARVDDVLQDQVARTGGHMKVLSKAGDDVTRLADELEASRSRLSGVEDQWRTDVAALAADLRGSVDRLTGDMRGTVEALSGDLRGDISSISSAVKDLLEQANHTGTQVSGVSERVSEITSGWHREQKALNAVSVQARENLAARLVTLDTQIESLADSLESLEALAMRAAPPIDQAAEKLGLSVNTLSLATESAEASAELFAQDVELARAARAEATDLAKQDRAIWKDDRDALHQQAEDIIAQMTTTVGRVDSLARELGESADGLPGQMGRLSGDMDGLGIQLQALQENGGALAASLGGRLSAVQDALVEAQAAMASEAQAIRDTGEDVREGIAQFEDGTRGLEGKIGGVGTAVSHLDKKLDDLGAVAPAAVDLTPVIDAVTAQGGDLASHMSSEARKRSEETIEAVKKHTDAFSTRIESRMDDHFDAQEHLIATGLSELTVALSGRTSDQGDAAADLARTLDAVAKRIDRLADDQAGVVKVLSGGPDFAKEFGELGQRVDSAAARHEMALRQVAEASDWRSQLNALDTRLDQVAEEQRQSFADLHAQRAEPVTDTISERIEPRLEALHRASDHLESELQGLALQMTSLTATNPSELLERVSRIEDLQSGLGDAQQAIAMGLRDGLVGIAHRLKSSDTKEMAKQLDLIVSALVRQQDRLTQSMNDLSGDIGSQLETLSLRLETVEATGRYMPRGANSDTATDRVARTAAPKENELGAIYDALRGLTAELKGFSPSADDGGEAPRPVPRRTAS